MKNKILLSFAMCVIATGCFAQMIKIDTVSFVKPGTQEVVLDNAITGNLEAFKDSDDAVIYIYRLKAMAGAAVKWIVQIGENEPAKISQNEYIIEHVNTKEKSYWMRFADMSVNYIGFEPNKYYIVRLKGFGKSTGFLTPENYAEIKECDLYKPKE